MTDRPPPHARNFDLATLGAEERMVELAPGPAERAAIAAWAGIDAVDSFSATIRLRRAGTDLYEYRASFAADVCQSCVVTLAPVRGHLEGAFERQYRVPPTRRRREREEDVVEDDGDTEMLSSGVLDLTAPVLEELVLGIDPYPRAPGAVLELRSDEAQSTNPFSILQKLKPKG